MPLRGYYGYETQENFRKKTGKIYEKIPKNDIKTILKRYRNDTVFPETPAVFTDNK